MIPLPDRRYTVIYADPPWTFYAYSHKGDGRSAVRHYPVMSLIEIQRIPVGKLALPDCALFLWVTAPLLMEGINTLGVWGFTYKTIAFTWVKQNRKADTLATGLGYWTRSNAEFCLLGTIGSPKRVSRSVHSVVISHREQHSRKPAIVRDRIVELMGDQPRIELFSRECIPGWDAWGLEVPDAGSAAEHADLFPGG